MVYAINYEYDPGCSEKKQTFVSGSTVNASQDSDGKWVYSCEDSSKQFNVFAWGDSINNAPANSVIYVRVDDLGNVSGFENASWITSGPDFLVGRMGSGNKTIIVKPGKSVKLIETGIYSENDWEELKSMYDSNILPSPWFAYYTMPLK